MQKKFLVIFLIVTVVFTSLFSDSQASALAKRYTAPKIIQSWRTGITSDSAGSSGYALADFNMDGVNELASCNEGYAFVLVATSDGSYEPSWYSDFIGCKLINSGDRNQDGIHELYVTTSAGEILVFDCDDYQLIATLKLPSTLEVIAHMVMDVENDGAQEIILIRSDALYIYDANTFELEWQANGWGGYDFAVGNIDSEPEPEIVIMGDLIYILDLATRSEEWKIERGWFPVRIELGELDGDDNLELIFLGTEPKIAAMDGETKTYLWQVSDIGSIDSVKVADLNQDGISEIVVNDSFFEKIRGYRGSDGMQLWEITNPEKIAKSLAIGDIDNDGKDEIIWGTNGGIWSGRVLFIGDWSTQTIEWSSRDLDGPLYVAADDINNDGNAEIIIASISTKMGYEGGAIKVYDGKSYQLKWSVYPEVMASKTTHMKTGQFDNDPAKEILLGVDQWNETGIQTFDGSSKKLEWQSGKLGSGPAPALVVKNIDHDELDEIFIGLNDYSVMVYNGTSDGIEWYSNILDSAIKDLSIGDLDGNSVDDLAILTAKSVYIFETGTWTQLLYQPISGGKQVAIANADQQSAGELLIIKGDAPNIILEGRQYPSFSIARTHFIGNVDVKDLVMLDIDNDDVLEYIVMGKDLKIGGEKSFLGIGARDHQSTWEYQANAYWGTIYTIASYDIDDDAQSEFLFSGRNLVQANEIATTDMYQTHLPITFRNNCFMPPMFLDDFSNPDSGWPILDTLTTHYYYQNGGYHILVHPANWMAGARPGIQATDFSVAVDLHNYASSENDFSGIAFGIAQDWSTFYLFAINWRGAYILYRFDPSSAAILAQGYSHALYTYDIRNHIKVVRNGNMIEAYTNNQLVASVSDGTYTGSRYLGLVAMTGDEEYYKTNFYNFSVYPPNCSGMNSPIILRDQNQFPTEQNTFGKELFPRR